MGCFVLQMTVDWKELQQVELELAGSTILAHMTSLPAVFALHKVIGDLLSPGEQLQGPVVKASCVREASFPCSDPPS